MIRELELDTTVVVRALWSVLDCAKAQEVEVGVTSDFPMILYKRSSCSFVKDRFSSADIYSLVVAVRLDTVSSWKLLLGLENFHSCSLVVVFHSVSNLPLLCV